MYKRPIWERGPWVSFGPGSLQWKPLLVAFEVPLSLDSYFILFFLSCNRPFSLALAPEGWAQHRRSPPAPSRTFRACQSPHLLALLGALQDSAPRGTREGLGAALFPLGQTAGAGLAGRPAPFPRAAAGAREPSPGGAFRSACGGRTRQAAEEGRLRAAGQWERLLHPRRASASVPWKGAQRVTCPPGGRVEEAAVCRSALSFLSPRACGERQENF